jgi:hypothetical protein
MSLTNALVLSDMTSSNASIDTNPTATGTDPQESTNPLPQQQTSVTPMTPIADTPDLFLNVAVQFPLADQTTDFIVTEIPFDDIIENGHPSFFYMEHIDGAIISTIRGSTKCSAIDRQTLRHIVGSHDYIISVIEIKHGTEYFRTIHSDKALEKYLIRKYDEYNQSNHEDDTETNLGIVTKITITFPPNIAIGHHLISMDSTTNVPPNIGTSPPKPHLENPGTPIMQLPRIRLSDPSVHSSTQRLFTSNDPPVAPINHFHPIHHTSPIESETNFLPNRTDPQDMESPTYYFQGRQVTMNVPPIHQSPNPSQHHSTHPVSDHLHSESPMVNNGTSTAIHPHHGQIHTSNATPTTHLHRPTMVDTIIHDSFMNMHIYTKDDYTKRLLNKSTNIDIKTFLKKENVPCKTKGMSWTIWYKRFTQYALKHGIFVPPYESLCKESVMGNWYFDLPEHVQDATKEWSDHIIQVLTNQTTIAPGPELTALQLLESGYNALYHLMRPHHPRLIDGYSTEKIPFQLRNESIPEYIARWTEFLIFQHEKSTPWTPMRAVNCIINSLQSPHNTWVDGQFQMECFSCSHDKSILPTRYNMGQITQTIETLITTNPHKQPFYNPSFRNNSPRNTIHAVRFTDAPTEFFDDELPDPEPATIHALQQGQSKEITGCELCKDTRHNTIDCYKAIAAAHAFAKKPELAQRILKKHAKPPVHPPTSRRNTVHCLVHDDDNPDNDEDTDKYTPAENGTINCLQCDRRSFPANIPSDANTLIQHTVIDNGIQSVTLNTAPDVFMDTGNIHSCQENIITPVCETQGIPIFAQFDGGADVNTTNQLSALWNLHKIDQPRGMSDVGDNRYVSHYRGYLVFRTHCPQKYRAILTNYTPSITKTLINPDEIKAQFPDITKCNEERAYLPNDPSFAVFTNKSAEIVFKLPLRRISPTLSWTEHVIMPTFQQRRSRIPTDLAATIESRPSITSPIYEDIIHDDIIHSLEQRHDTTEAEASAEEVICDLDAIADMADKVDFVIHQLKAQALAQLWHQRMGHIDPETASKMHKHVDGVPKLSRPTILDNCPTCIDAKLQKSNASTENSRIATQCFQGISIDFSFIIGKSRNSDRYTDNLGLNGETCYIHLVDHFSGMVFGKPFQTKAPPLQWLNQWLARYSPDIQNKTVRFDQGGELGRCKAILELFQNFGYAIELTGADASHQNGCVERSHKTIGNMMRTLLNGADLPQ